MSCLSGHRALRLFAQHLQQRPALDDAGVEELCRAHPELEADLRELARERAAAEVDAPRIAAARAKKLRNQGASRDRYVLLGEISRGAEAVVLHVWDALLERPLAMKLLDPAALPQGAQAADEAFARFFAEARIAGQLQHPGVVPILDLGGDEQGRVYFTMPYFEGRNLEQIFELARSHSEGWSVTRALALLEKACDVMAYAHARGVIHRDLKPSNLIAGVSGEVYIADWGLAKAHDPQAKSHDPQAKSHDPQAKACDAERAEPDEDHRAAAVDGAQSGQSLDGTVAGTPPYMAPEQAEGRVQDVSFRSDIYAFGAMLYRLLAGRAPYAPRRGTDAPAKTIELIRRGPPTPLRKLAADAPEALLAIHDKAMAREARDRYASIADLARDLRAYLRAREGELERR
jgi:serine/threonine protein kinase